MKHLRSLGPVVLMLTCLALPRASGKLPAREGVPPIRISDKASTSRDVMARQREWAERIMLKPFKENVADKPWTQEALSFVEEAVKAWAEDPIMEFTRIKSAPQATSEDVEGILARRGLALIKAGCDDPLVRFLTNHMRFRIWDTAGLGKSARQTVNQLSSSTVYPKSVAYLAALYAGEIFDATENPKERDEVEKLAPELAIQALRAGDYSGKDDFLFLFQTQLFQYLARNYDEFAKVCALEEMPEWIQLSLLGRIETERAWKSRGEGWASEVTAEGWKGFHEHLELARTQLTKAWKLRPDRPEAATEMIVVAMGGGANEGDTPRVWFDRATAAQINYFAAYKCLLWAYRPRWCGSHAAMLGFGNACVATNRYDLRLPRYYLRAVEGIIDDTKNWRAVYHDPTIGPKIVEVTKALAEEKNWPRGWRSFMGYLAIHAYMAGDGKMSAEAFKKINNRLTHEQECDLKSYGLTLSDILEELPALDSLSTRRHLAAEDLFFDKKLEAASKAYQALAHDSNRVIAGNARVRLQEIQLQQQVEKGEWVKLPVSGWKCRGAEWTVSPEGLLQPGEAREKTLLLAPVRLGDSFEVRIDFEYSAPENPKENGFRAVLGYTGEGNHYFNCGYSLGAGQTSFSVGDSWDHYTEDRGIRIPVQSRNRLWVRVWEGGFTYYLNGTKGREVAANSGICGEWAQSRLGLCSMGSTPGCRVAAVSVRLLKTPPQAPDPKDLVPEAQ